MALLSALTLENFRSFRRRTTIELAPLTILTGPNSSGKSSVLKALLFLRHNARLDRLNNPTFSGGGHQLGSLSAALSRGGKSKRVTFGQSFDWGEHDEWEYRGDDGVVRVFDGAISHVRFGLEYGPAPNLLEDQSITGGVTLPPDTNFSEDVRLLRYTVAAGPLGDEQPLFKLSIGGDIVEIEVDLEDAATGEPFSQWMPLKECYYEVAICGSWFFSDATEAYHALGFPEVRNSDAEEVARLLASTLRFKLKRSGPSKLYDPYAPPPTLRRLVDAVVDPARWGSLTSNGEHVSEAVSENPFLSRALDAFIRPYLSRWTEYLGLKLGEIDHVGALRASPRRLYSDDGDDPFTELLRSHATTLALVDKRRQAGRDEVERLLDEFGIGTGLHVERVGDAAYTVEVEREGGKTHLADLGYGFTQLVPLIMHAAYDHDTLARPFPTLLVEEPEANLHPNLQAKLADLFVRMSRPEGAHTVVETHSEYLVRRLQYLVAKGDVEPERIALYYLGTNPEADDYVRRIEIDRHGQLSQEFGPGFFDEATNLMINLYKYGSEN